MKEIKQHVYIIGSKGIPAKYGGFETFVEKLTENQKSSNIKYHVACMNLGDNLYGEGKTHFEHNGADCFNVNVSSKIGPARAIAYDIKALKYAINLAKKNQDKEPIFYILACRIGPFIKTIKTDIKAINGKLFVNPDGHEWLRAKWSRPVRKYWKESERLMVKHADLLICDSKNIEKYIHKDYAKYHPKTTYIAYGADITSSKLKDNDQMVVDWFESNKIFPNNYYLVVGRFVPENNYETMIREFMKSKTNKDFVLITNIKGVKFYEKLKATTKFDTDKRIKFVGTVYNQELLKKIRERAFAYLHGHEVGGTNPSLLEALGSTKLNLLLDVGFNREVAEDGALYWIKESSNLSNLIDKLDREYQLYEILNEKSEKRIFEFFTWTHIVTEYENFFQRNSDTE